MLSWLCAAGVVLVLAQAPSSETKPISNFWVHLNEILDAEEAKPLVAPDPGARFPPPRTYPFDAIVHIRPGELVRAATEGIRDARRKSLNQPEDLIERQCRANIQRCLEYYPLLMTRDDDIVPLLATLEDPNAEPLLRLYLMERVTPGVVPRSNFADFFQDVLRRDPKRINKVFALVVGSTQEVEETLRIAVDAWYRYAYADYLAWFEGDPNVAGFSAAHGGAPVLPKQLRDTPGLTLNAASLGALPERNQIFVEMATAMATQLLPANNRPLAIKAIAEAGIQHILEEIPLENPGEVRAMLTPADALPPVAPATDVPTPLSLPNGSLHPSEEPSPLPE